MPNQVGIEQFFIHFLPHRPRPLHFLTKSWGLIPSVMGIEVLFPETTDRSNWNVFHFWKRKNLLQFRHQNEKRNYSKQSQMFMLMGAKMLKTYLRIAVKTTLEQGALLVCSSSQLVRRCFLVALSSVVRLGSGTE